MKHHFLNNNILLNNRGVMLLMAFYVSIILAGLGLSFIVASVNESKSVENIRRKTVAFNIAEAGMERVIYDLRQDCVDSPDSVSWADGSINGNTISYDTTMYYSVTYANTINAGNYSVSLKNVPGEEKSIWVKSVGTLGDVSQTVEAYVKVYNINMWGNAVFVGSGDAGEGEGIGENANMYGSVHVLGTGLSGGDGDLAIDLGGAEYVIGNNYGGMSGALNNRIVALGTTIVNSEVVETIESNVWIKQGQVGLSGDGTIGVDNVDGNSIKEKVDGVYVGETYGGTSGISNVYSDNGYKNSYPLGDSIVFPSFSNAYPGYSDYEDYLFNNSLVLDSVPELANMAAITPESNFAYEDLVTSKGSISMDGSGNMVIAGKVYIDGGPLNIVEGVDRTINFSGDGVIYSEGDVSIDINFVTTGKDSFPASIIGFMTPGDMSINTNLHDIMGLFFAEDSITVSGNGEVAGTLVSNYVDMGSDGPSIYQVPSTISEIPSGMIGDSTTCFMKVLSWSTTQN